MPNIKHFYEISDGNDLEELLLGKEVVEVIKDDDQDEITVVFSNGIKTVEMLIEFDGSTPIISFTNEMDEK